MTTIKPCPFCGETENGHFPPKAIEIGGAVFGSHYAVVCENCNSMGCSERVRIKSVNTTMELAIKEEKKRLFFYGIADQKLKINN